MVISSGMPGLGNLSRLQQRRQGPNVTYFDSAKVRFAVPADPLAFVLDKSKEIVYILMGEHTQSAGFI